MAYRTLLFDLDDTLLDSAASQSAAWSHTFASLGVADATPYRARFVAINTEMWAAVERGEMGPEEVRLARFERLVADTALELDPIALADTFAAGLGAFGGLLPGARGVLDALASRARLAMVTNGIGEVQRARLARLDLVRYFDAIVVSGEVGVAKPDEAIFDLTFDRLEMGDRRATLMIGDSLTSDIAGGGNAGIDTCWFNPHGRPAATGSGATHEVTRLEELTSLVDGGSVRSDDPKARRTP